VAAAILPALLATKSAILASLVANALPARLATGPAYSANALAAPSSPLLKPMLIVLGVLLPALASPIPYWLSSTVAATPALAITVSKRRGIMSWPLIPCSCALLAG